MRKPQNEQGSQTTIAAKSTSSRAGSTSKSSSGSPPTSTTTAASEELDLVFECQKSALYHADRIQFFDRLHKIILFCVALTGTAAFATLSFVDNRFMGIAVAVLGVVGLIFDFSGAVARHSDLRRRFLELLSKVKQEPGLPSHTAALRAIYEDEGPTFNFVNAVAYNATCRLLGYSEDHQFALRPYQVYLRNFLPANHVDFVTKREQRLSKKRAN